DPTLASVSLATILSRSAPILLSGVPFRNTITWKMHETYTWCLVGMLVYMVLVLGGNLKLIPPPPPNSITSYMYHVCDSAMLQNFEGLSTASEKVRDKAVIDVTVLTRMEDNDEDIYLGP
ncbi:hypothetical protein V8F06_014897, partial [Rhypophila decipiens]